MIHTWSSYNLYKLDRDFFSSGHVIGQCTIHKRISRGFIKCHENIIIIQCIVQISVLEYISHCLTYVYTIQIDHRGGSYYQSMWCNNQVNDINIKNVKILWFHI